MGRGSDFMLVAPQGSYTQNNKTIKKVNTVITQDQKVEKDEVHKRTKNYIFKVKFLLMKNFAPH